MQRERLKSKGIYEEYKIKESKKRTERRRRKIMILV